MNDAPHILASGLIWMLLGNSLRYIGVGAQALAPLGNAAWCAVWARGSDTTDYAAKLREALDGIYLRLISAFTTPASATLIYAGILFSGVGLLVGAMANVLRYTTDSVTEYSDYAQASSAVAIMLVVVGMSCKIAAVSQRRTASLIMSAGFVLAGLGIGIVTVTWGMR